jgi:hypothetical protein
MATEFEQMLLKAKSGQLVKVYLAARDKRDAADEIVKQHQKTMDLVGRFIFMRLAEEEQESFTAHGACVYTYDLTSAKAADKAAFMQYIRDYDAYDLLEVRPSKTACKTFQENSLEEKLAEAVEHGEPTDGIVGDLPPGVELSAITKLGVRKA